MVFYGEGRKKLRLEGFDYGNQGYYFVTICTKGRIDYFGDIEDGKNNLSDYGKIVYKCWESITEHYQGIELDEFVIMPNHIHGIIIVGNEYFRSDKCDNTKNDQYFSSDKEEVISRPNISNVIKGFKIGVTKEIRQKHTDYEFAWQKSFHDVIIGNQEQLDKTREYIILNPSKWEDDVNNLIYIKPGNA